MELNRLQDTEDRLLMGPAVYEKIIEIDRAVVATDYRPFYVKH